MSLPGIETHCLNSVAFGANGEYLLASGGAMVPNRNESKTLRELIAWKLPAFDLDWHHVEEAKFRISGMTMSPDGNEFITNGATHADVWKFKTRQPVRRIVLEFLCGDVTYSIDGRNVIAPAGNELTLRSSSTGKVTKRIVLARNSNTAAKAVAFLPGGAGN